jgi:hypothetical protein
MESRSATAADFILARLRTENGRDVQKQDRHPRRMTKASTDPYRASMRRTIFINRFSFPTIRQRAKSFRNLAFHLAHTKGHDQIDLIRAVTGAEVGSILGSLIPCGVARRKFSAIVVYDRVAIRSSEAGCHGQVAVASRRPLRWDQLYIRKWRRRRRAQLGGAGLLHGSYTVRCSARTGYRRGLFRRALVLVGIRDCPAWLATRPLECGHAAAPFSAALADRGHQALEGNRRTMTERSR